MTNNGKRPRRRYDDKFRASAVVMLEAAGYPDREGALSHTANHLGIPLNTLKGWFTAKNNPPPAKLRNKKRLELTELLRNELHCIFDELPRARPDASYRDLGTVAAIFVDKLQLLEGKPTWIVEITNLLKDGSISPEQVENELGSELATELFESIGLSVVGTREAQTQSAETSSE